MKTSRIKSMEVGSSFRTDSGRDLWNVEIVMEDGTQGIALAQSDSPPYHAGDDVEYSVEGQRKSGENKLKVKLAEGSADHSSGSGAGSTGHTHAAPADRGAGARVGMAINNAVSSWIAGKIAEDAMPEFACRLVRLADWMENHPEAVLKEAADGRKEPSGGKGASVPAKTPSRTSQVASRPSEPDNPDDTGEAEGWDPADTEVPF